MKQEVKTSNNTVIVAAVMAITLGVGGFVGGMQYQKSQGVATTSTSAMTAVGGGGMGMGGQMNGGLGSVTAVSANSITLQNQRDNTTTTYTVSGNTTITDSSATVTSSDIRVGDTVRVETSSSTSKAATAIIVNPTMNGGPGMGTSPGSAPTNIKTN